MTDKYKPKPLDFANGIPKIKFEKEFDEWGKDEQIKYLKDLASAMNEAARVLYEERLEIAGKLDVANTAREAAQTNINQIKDIMTRNITDSNSAKESFLNEINQLKADLRQKDATIKALEEKSSSDE